MNFVFFGLVAAAYCMSAWREIFQLGVATSPAPMQALGTAAITAASEAVSLAVGLIGIMVLFLGLMKIAEEGGALRVAAVVVRPLMQRLFPEVPSSHPAMGAMVMNISANALGLGNAATPFGIRAMQHLQTLNPNEHTATNAMVLFLAINTANVTLLPTSVIALRAAAGSADPAGILPTTLFATACSTFTAVTVARLGQRVWPLPPAGHAKNVGPHALVSSPHWRPEEAEFDRVPTCAEPSSVLITWATACLALAVLACAVWFGTEASHWIIPTLIATFLAFGIWQKVPVYESFVKGGKEGFEVVVRIIPYLVATLVAIGMLKASGTLDIVLAPVGALLAPLGLPAEGLVMALLRTLTGAGSFAYLASLFNEPATGPDSYIGYLASTIQASTETTFYVISVYFGSVGIIRFRHAVIAGLSADVVGVIASVAICLLLHGR